MSLTLITPDVIDLPKVTVALINDPTIGGIKNYIDTPLTTPAQFDNSVAAATTAFVQRNGLAFPMDIHGGGIGIVTDTILTSSQFGRWISLNVANLTITLPPLSGLEGGLTYTFNARHAFTLVTSGTDLIYNAGITTGTTRYCIAGETFTIVTNPEDGWYIVSNGFGTDSFTGSITTNGYQKLPGDLIVQWGASNTVTGYQDHISFPIAFPTNVFLITANENNATGWSSSPQPTIYGTTKINNSMFAISGLRLDRTGVPSYHANLGFSWIAIGN